MKRDDGELVENRFEVIFIGCTPVKASSMRLTKSFGRSVPFLYLKSASNMHKRTGGFGNFVKLTKNINEMFKEFLRNLMFCCNITKNGSFLAVKKAQTKTFLIIFSIINGDVFVSFNLL